MSHEDSERQTTHPLSEWIGVRLRQRYSESSVLPIVIAATSSNHSGCGGLRRCEMKACPICNSRVAKPAFAVPVGDLPREEFPSQFDLALRVSLRTGDSHTRERFQYCRTGFPIGSSLLTSLGRSWPRFKFWSPQKDRVSCIPVQLREHEGFFPEAYDLEFRRHPACSL